MSHLRVILVYILTGWERVEWEAAWSHQQFRSTVHGTS